MQRSVAAVTLSKPPKAGAPSSILVSYKYNPTYIYSQISIFTEYETNYLSQ